MKLCLAAISMLVLATVQPTLASDVTPVSWATATKGGGFQLFGENIAAAINAADGQLSVKAIATRGSRHNLELLEAGDVDVGQVEGNAARIALDGVDRPAADLRVLSVMYPNPGMFVVRGDTAYESIEDLKGQPIAFGTKASGLRILVADVLDGLGLEPDKDFQQIILVEEDGRTDETGRQHSQSHHPKEGIAQNFTARPLPDMLVFFGKIGCPWAAFDPHQQ